MNSQQISIIRTSLNEFEQMCHSICSGNTKELVYVRMKMAEHLASMTLGHLQMVSSMFDKDQELLLEFLDDINELQTHMEIAASNNALIPELRAVQNFIGQIEHYIKNQVYISELVWPEEEEVKEEEAQDGECEIEVIDDDENSECDYRLD